MIPLHDNVPTLRPPVVNWALIAINVLVFLYELSLGASLEEFVRTWAVVPANFIHHNGAHQIAALFSGMFMHGGWLHLLGNMWALWIFGDNVEDRMGHWRYLAFYLLSGIAAGLAQVWVTPNATIPAVGASGAIAGVMAAFLVLFPQSRVRTWFGGFFIFMLPAWFVVGEWFLVQVINGFSILSKTGSPSGIAWFAHLGGFCFGVLFTKLFQDPNYPRQYRPPTRAREPIS